MQGIEYMHSIGIVHRDIKLDNLMLDSEFNLKIIDFGLSAQMDETQMIKAENVGSAGYQSPELLDDDVDTSLARPIDIFAAGVILFSLYLEIMPFDIETANTDIDPSMKFVKEKNWDEFWETQ